VAVAVGLEVQDKQAALEAQVLLFFVTLPYTQLQAVQV
jgi:hypothetical protein